MGAQYGIAANVKFPDSCLRIGAKVWVLGGAGGEGFDRLRVLGKSRGGREIEKWVPIKRLNNFRCKWVLEEKRSRFYGYPTGILTKKEADRRSSELNEYNETGTLKKWLNNA